MRSFTKPIPILFENDECLVFEKPSGLLVTETPKEKVKTLVNIVNHQYKNQRDERKLFPCHRLDRETSGVILFAKGKKNQKILMDLFRERNIKKTYIAIVQGQLKKRLGNIQTSIEKKQAQTKFEVQKIKDQFSVLVVEPLTGRTNQIRIHLKSIGHPVVGDRKFSIVKHFPVKFKRAALHANLLTWKDPFSGNTLEVRSELPEDLRMLLEK